MSAIAAAGQQMATICQAGYSRSRTSLRWIGSCCRAKNQHKRHKPSEGEGDSIMLGIGFGGLHPLTLQEQESGRAG